MTARKNRLRVLSIDGGGMRGLYTATYLSMLSTRYEMTRGVGRLDIGKGFDLIAATSTGAIIACALATGLPLERVAKLYREFGSKVFPAKLPKQFSFQSFWHLLRWSSHLKAGAAALKESLDAVLGESTLASIWQDRGIALAIPVVHMSNHRAWVFKTPHLRNRRHRDDGYSLANVCLAATAAPVYRSMARLDNPGANDGHKVFVDGALWANNPVLVGLIDALELGHPGDRIEIYCLGTCPRPAGEQVGLHDIDRGPLGWKFGGEVSTVSISAQEYAFDHMARMLGRHVNRDCSIVRFPHGTVPADMMKYLDLDETDPIAMETLASQADTDVSETLSRTGDTSNADGQLLNSLFEEIPTLTTARS